MLETLDFTIRIGSTPTFLYFDLYLYSAYAAHYIHLWYNSWVKLTKLLRKNLSQKRTVSEILFSEVSIF